MNRFFVEKDPAESSNGIPVMHTVTLPEDHPQIFKFAFILLAGSPGVTGAQMIYRVAVFMCSLGKWK